LPHQLGLTRNCAAASRKALQYPLKFVPENKDNRGGYAYSCEKRDNGREPLHSHNIAAPSLRIKKSA
jgi:hypothetical protein